MHVQPEQDPRAEPLRVAVAAAGTAGHVLPALAVADELRRRGALVTVIGGDRAEVQLVREARFPLQRIPAAGLDRRNPLRAGRALLRSGAGVIAAARALRRARCDVVLGSGGYSAGIVGAAAILLRLPLVLTEADSHLGLANRILARHARCVCLAFPIAGARGGRFVVTGRPLPAAPIAREQARAQLGCVEGQPFVVIFGGSLGSARINAAALAARAPLAGAGARVLHIAGAREYAQLARGLGEDRQGSGYELRELLEPQALSLALSAADLVVCRAGGSVLEVAAHGAPMILVPYPHAAADHQRANAARIAAAGAAVVIEDRELSGERLAQAVLELLGDRKRLAGMAAAARSLGRTDAAALIAQEVEAAAAATGGRRR
ncbi:MAG TPA: undecaprenyldiphospho-muramoylpentapeptide beta-N-acetylglucosaminyltransferase [Solirubrobacteraceae bacterium]|nr:undecaprenyldiphospho-muramoylpentapeptide beta-N-acetylglucosaminyltransferase [Solirubrobacteraceae bacterium]